MTIGAAADAGRSGYGRNHLAGILRAASLGRDDAVFATVEATGERITYGAFFRGAEKAASALAQAGVRPGDRVAAQTEKSVQALALYVGTVLAGGVYLPLNSAYKPAEVAYFLADAEPAVFVCDPARTTELAPCAEAAGVTTVLTLDAAGGGTLSERIAGAAPGFGAVPRAAWDTAAILYTSGTTGRPKGAVLSHRALASNSLTLRDIWRFTADDVLIHALPIFHTHGLFVATNVT
ncbi:MAG: AMP-binding protein, partial [Paracoccaceae bacterium]